MNKKGQTSRIISLVVFIVIAIAAALSIFIDLTVTQQTLQVVAVDQVTTTALNQSQNLDHLKNYSSV